VGIRIVDNGGRHPYSLYVGVKILIIVNDVYVELLVDL